MADEESAGEKSEQPTGKKVSHSREQGMVGQSADLSAVMSMGAAFYTFLYFSAEIWNGLVALMKSSLNFATVEKEGVDIGVFHFISAPIIKLAPMVFFVMLAAAIFGATSTLLQTNFLWAPKLFKPKFSQLNPFTGIKRLFKINNIVTLGKSILKLMVIGPIGYFSFMNFFPALLNLMALPVSQFLPIGGEVIRSSFVKIMSLLLILAILDLVWQKWRNHVRMKMTKQEVKDESKATEGDQSTKRRMLSIGMQRARQRMMQDVPKADVVVTNPTHLAIALSYSGEPGIAPIVVAKGRGFVAKRIREIAKRKWGSSN